MQTVSVIVPAYNVEKYIYKCIKSICDQDYSDFEIIVVIDGATDGTLEICKKIAADDAKVKIFEQSNLGLVEARKRGLKEATGDLILFVDGDDWIEKDYIRGFILESEQSQTNIVISNSVSMDYGSSLKIEYSEIPAGVYDKHHIRDSVYPSLVYDEITEKPGIFAFLVGKLFYKSDLIQQYSKIDFDIRLGEDGAVSFPLIAKSDMISVIDNPGYHYVQRKDSMSTSLTMDDMQSLERVKSHFARCVESTGNSDVLIRQYKIYVRDLVIRIANVVYEIDLGKILCTVPYEILKKDECIVIYGAGKVGREYVKSFLKSRYVRISGWLDRNYCGKIYGISIEKPEMIAKLSYDRILIAVDDKETAKEIREQLVLSGADENEIIWQPVCWG